MRLSAGDMRDNYFRPVFFELVSHLDIMCICSQLEDDCLSATTASCPLIEKLILMSCNSIGSEGLSSLCWLKNLTYLDLSYTFLMDLQPVFKSCLRLTVTLLACFNNEKFHFSFSSQSNCYGNSWHMDRVPSRWWKFPIYWSTFFF